MGADSDVRGTSDVLRSLGGTDRREPSPSRREAKRLRLGNVVAGLLLVLEGAACSTPPEVRSGDPRAGHEFVLREDFRGQVRKIAVKFEPGGVLQWELVRSDDPERNKSLFASLDYGESPECMDQSFPSGVPERPGPGQVISMTLHYGREGEPDPIVPGVVIRWFQKKGRSFSELTEQEAEEHSRKADQGEKH